MDEARSINKSISALGNCINALIFPKRYRHVPYRDSKLTRVLSDSLGGNSKTTLIACISPSLIQYDETLSTLLYANSAQHVNTFAIVNEEIKIQSKSFQQNVSALDDGLDDRFAVLQSENYNLRSQIQELQKRQGTPHISSRTMLTPEDLYKPDGIGRRAKSTIGTDGDQLAERVLEIGRQFMVLNW